MNEQDKKKEDLEKLLKAIGDLGVAIIIGAVAIAFMMLLM